MNIVLLAGGIGKRLWPISNESLPKQFLILPKIKKSCFQLCLERSLKITKAENITIITNIKFKALIIQQIKALNLETKKFNILLESNSNNTAMAVYYSCLFLKKDLTYFFPTDQIIHQDPLFFSKTIEKINSDKINIFGQASHQICENFGYITTGKKLKHNYYQVMEFIEKPSLKKNVGIGNTYRNLGIYLAKIEAMQSEFHKLYNNLPIVEFYKQDEFYHINSESLDDKLPIDKMITEHSKIINMIVAEFEWQDIGSISKLYQYFGKQKFFNHLLNKDEIEKFNDKNKEFLLSYKTGELEILKKTIINEAPMAN